MSSRRKLPEPCLQNSAVKSSARSRKPQQVEEPNGSNGLSDLRLSFKWFFVRLIWGPEKRNRDRIKQELEQHPPMARQNLPMLASLFAGYMGLWYVALIVTTAVFYFFFA